MNITELIDKYGSTLASQLKIATEQVYDKLIWYIKVDGLIGIIQVVISFIVVAILGKITHKICKKNKLEYEELFMAWFVSTIIMLVLVLCLNLAFIPFIKLFFPEFHLMRQVINSIK